jgi:hypothetical protein
VSRGAFVGRRVAFALSVAITLALAVGAGAGKATLIGPGGGVCSGSAGGMSATKTLDATTVAVTWCWNGADNLTYLSVDASQASHWSIYLPTYISLDNKTGGVGAHTFSENFTSHWLTGTCEVKVGYWLHVVGGSQTMDFVETSNSEGSCG